MWKNFKSKLFKTSSLGDAWASVKKQFNLGELVHTDPGIRVFREKSTQNLIRVHSGSGGISVAPLYPTSMQYAEYMARVGKPAGAFKIYLGGRYRKMYPHIGKVTPTEYANKTGPRGLSKEYSFPSVEGKYFVPNITCL